MAGKNSKGKNKDSASANANTKSGFERKLDSQNNVNSKYVDLLEEDKPIAGQKFACISFVSPEKIIKQKEIFYFEEFLKKWDINKSMEKFVQFLNFISYKYHLSFDDISNERDRQYNLPGSEYDQLHSINDWIAIAGQYLTSCSNRKHTKSNPADDPSRGRSPVCGSRVSTASNLSVLYRSISKTGCLISCLICSVDRCSIFVSVG
jgi:hypothetical protein